MDWKVARIDLSSSDPTPHYVDPYCCRFCGKEVQYTTKECPKCGIPWPSTEAMGKRFILKAVSILVAGGLLGSLAGLAAHRRILGVVGVLVGLVAAWLVTQWSCGCAEVRMRTHALIRMYPGMANLEPYVVAAKIGTPAVAIVAKAIKEIEKGGKYGYS